MNELPVPETPKNEGNQTPKKPTSESTALMTSAVISAAGQIIGGWLTGRGNQPAPAAGTVDYYKNIFIKQQVVWTTSLSRHLHHFVWCFGRWGGKVVLRRRQTLRFLQSVQHVLSILGTVMPNPVLQKDTSQVGFVPSLRAPEQHVGCIEATRV
jgi:hypothetical protein